MNDYKTRGLILLLLFIGTTMQAQVKPYKKKVEVDGKMKKVWVFYDEMEVDVSPELAWEKIAVDYIHIGDFHTSLESSAAVEGKPVNGLGAERVCRVNAKATAKESIVQWDPVGRSFTYQAFEVKGMPFSFAQNQMSITEKDGKTYISTQVQLRTTPPFLIAMGKKKMQKNLVEGLLVYRNYLENEDASKPEADVLRGKYNLRP